LVDEAEFVARLRSGDREASRRVVLQIEGDRKAGSGNSTGLEMFSKAFRPKVLAFQAQFLGDDGAAEEAWNDVLVDVWEHVSTYEERRAKFSTWVFERAKYAARRRKRQLRKEQRQVGIGETPQVIPEPLTRSQRQAVRRAFRRLNETQQKLVLLNSVAGLSPAEIVTSGKIPGCPVEHIRVYLNRAYKRLRNLYEEELSL